MNEEEAKNLSALAIQKAMDKNSGQLLLNSEFGVKLLKVELINLFSRIEKIVTIQAKEAHKKLGKVILQQRSCLIEGGKLTVQLRWDAKFKNTLEDSALWVVLWKGKPGRKRRSFIKWSKLKEIEKKKFVFHLTNSGGREWKEIDSKEGGASLTSEQLAYFAVDLILDALKKAETVK